MIRARKRPQASAKYQSLHANEWNEIVDLFTMFTEFESLKRMTSVDTVCGVLERISVVSGNMGTSALHKSQKNILNYPKLK